MKKVLSLILAVALVFSLLLTGCGTKGGEADKTAPAASAASTATAAEPTPSVPEKTTEISWYFPGNGDQKGIVEVEEAANEYLKDKINATLKLYPTGWDVWENKTKMMAAAGDEFDIEWSTLGWNYHFFVYNGAFKALDELIDKNGTKLKELLGEDLLNGTKVDGKIYAIPVKKDTADARAFYFNKALLDKYGFDINTINKYEDIEPWLAKIKESEKDIVPLNLQDGQGILNLLGYESLLGDSSLPGVITLENGDAAINQFKDQKMMDAWKTLRKWYTAGYIDKEAGTKSTRFSALKDEGKCLVFVDAATPGKESDVSNSKVSYVMKQMTPITVSNSTVGGSMHSISSTSDDPERAMMFLELVNTDKYLNNLINFGIENKHYKKVDENTFEPIENSGYNNIGMQWMYANQFLNFVKKGDDPERMKKVEEYSKAGKPFKSLGFYFKGRDNFANELAALKNISTTYYAALSVGALDPEKEAPNYLKKLDDAGAQKLLDALNAEYQEFLKSK